MARRIIREEREQRGCFGWGLLILFWVFNAFMVYAVFGGLFNISQMAQPTSQAEQAGRAIGTGIGLWLLGTIWVMGDLILGIPVLLTRGRRVMVEETSSEDPVDTSRWSERDRALEEKRRQPLIDITPRERQSSRTALPDRRTAAPEAAAAGVARWESRRQAFIALKVLAEAGADGFDDQAVDAALTYLEAEIGTSLKRRDAADAEAWMRDLPSTNETAIREAVRHLREAVASPGLFIQAMISIAGQPPSTERQARWFIALQRALEA